MGGVGGKQSSTYRFSHSHDEEEEERTHHQLKSMKNRKSKYATAISNRPLSVSSGSIRGGSEAELPLVVSSLGYELHRKIGDGAFSK